MALEIVVNGNDGFVGYPDDTVRIIMKMAGIDDLSRIKGMVVEIKSTRSDVRVVQVTIKKGWSKEWKPEWDECLDSSKFKKSRGSWTAKVNLEDQNQPYEIRVVDSIEKYTPGQKPAPKAETQIKVSGDSAKVLRDFVNKNLVEIDNNHKITTFFIDTEAEYEKYGVNIPGICLVVADKRATKASLKKEPLVIKFDKSKTLKRYSDWKKGSVPNVEGEAWYTIYVSAAEARSNGVKALKEETDTMTKIGFLNEEGSLVLMPVKGGTVAVNGEIFLVEEVDGQFVDILNEESDYQVSEGDLDEAVVELEPCDELGEVCDGMVCIGKLDESLVYADDSDDVYLYEAMTDKLEPCMVYRSRKDNSPIVTGDVKDDSDTVMYWNTDGDHFTIKKLEFSKKFKAGKVSDFDLFESVRDMED